jgi:Protein of unknown function (DUF3768)
MSFDKERIRALNDTLRQHLTGGGAVMTPGVAALGNDFVVRAVKALAAFDDFHHDCDPHQEHDAGVFELDGHMLFFKIDYYDRTLTFRSPNPADPAMTERVITLMLIDEY